MKMKKPFVQACDTRCLHCGGAENQLFCHGGARPDGTPFDLLYHVACKQCRACGPIAKTAAEAIKAYAHHAAIRAEEDPRGFLDGLEMEEEQLDVA
jgi:hypothetical protein